MDMKEKLLDYVKFSSDMRADPRLVYLLGILGIGAVLLAGWLYFSDSTASRAAERANQEIQQVLEQVLAPVQSIKNALNDAQVQRLAAAAINDDEKLSDLIAELKKNDPNFTAAMVLSTEDIASFNPASLPNNGFAVLDLALSVQSGKKALLQIHQSLDEPALFDAVPLVSGEELAGVLIAAADPAAILDPLTPELSHLKYVGLVQYNGRQATTYLKRLGDVGMSEKSPEYVSVPGTMLRMEYPQARHISVIGGQTLVLMLIVGLLFVAVAYVLHQNNKKNPAPQEKALEADEEPLPAVVEPQAPAADSMEDAGFEDEPEARPAEPEPEPTPVAQTPPPEMHLHYDIAERRRRKEANHAPVELNKEIFRAYDIRGIIDKTLDSGIARSIGQAVGSRALERDAGPVVVARDGRLSGPYLMKGVIEGILSTGCDVIDIGAVPTGVLYYAAHEFANGSAIVITGSHNPPDYNGFKIMIGGDTLHGDAITALYDRIVSGDLKTGEGRVERRNVIKDYILRISEDVKVEKPLRVVIDCGNGIGGVCAADTLRAIGVEVLPLYDEVDGTFPNHHPDPSEPENLTDLIESVRLMDADLGLALDGDADRLGVVTLAGNIIYPDRVLMLLALDVLDRVPGATILYDVKCTGHLPKVIREAGGNPVMYKTGHSLMKAKMKEMGAPFAGEMSGHFFFGERWYGVDDGIYAAARLLEILGGAETPPEAILNALPSSFSTPELKVPIEESEKHSFVETLKDAIINAPNVASHFEGAEINTIDGVRVDFEDGWGLVRASNTTPILVVRFDAESEVALERIKSLFRRQMLELNPDLELPF